MLASIWRIIRDRVEDLDVIGVHEDNVKTQILKNEELRIDYLVLYNIVSRLADTLQVRFAQAAFRSSRFISSHAHFEQRSRFVHCQHTSAST